MTVHVGLSINTLYTADWRWTADDSDVMHQTIISYFSDMASTHSPFSIQQLISVGRDTGRKAGDWYGPASIANALWYDDSFIRLFAQSVQKQQ